MVRYLTMNGESKGDALSFSFALGYRRANRAPYESGRLEGQVAPGSASDMMTASSLGSV